MVLETVGGEVLRAVWPVLAPFGRVVVAGFASLNLQRWNPLSWLRTWRDLPRADIRTLAPASHGLMATHIGYLLADPPRLARVWDALMAFVSAHGIRPVVGATFAFDEMGGGASTHGVATERGEDRGTGLKELEDQSVGAWGYQAAVEGRFTSGR